MSQIHFRVIVKFNDGTEDMVFEYSTAKVANGVAKRYMKASCVKHVEVEEV